MSEGDELTIRGFGKVLTIPEASLRRKLAGPGVPIKRVRGKRPACAHRQTEIDKEARVLLCRDCKAHVDPIDFLVLLSSVSDYTEARDEKKRLEKECAAIEAQIAKLKDKRSSLKRVSTVKWSAVTKTLNALHERIRREAAKEHASGYKLGEGRILACGMWIDVARQELEKCLEEPDRLDHIPEVKP